jgi:glycosyltransferase involved in cell wall biosynthesis
MTPLVTIIIPTFNNSVFLRSAIQSALAQTFSSFEILVTDNSNSDETRALCDSFQNPKIRYRSNPTNIGIVSNFIAGINDARGTYISLLCDDDEWEPDFLEKLVTPLEKNSQIMVAFGTHSIMSADGKIDWQRTMEFHSSRGRADLAAGPISADDLDDLFLERGGFGNITTVYRKEMIDSYLDLLRFGEVSPSYDIWLCCILAAHKVPTFFIPEKLTRYRIHDKQYTTSMHSFQQRANHNLELATIWRKSLELNFFENRQGVIKRNYGRALFEVAKDNLYAGLVDNARENFLEAFKYIKSIKSLLGLIITYCPTDVRVALNLTKAQTVSD